MKREVSASDQSVFTVNVPLTFHRRGGRKLVMTPDGGSPDVPPRRRIDNTIVKALARAFRWKRLLDGGEYTTINELAAAEKINESYVCRVLRLTLLAPDIVETILDGRQPPQLQMHVLLKPFPVRWDEQRTTIRLEPDA